MVLLLRPAVKYSTAVGVRYLGLRNSNVAVFVIITVMIGSGLIFNEESGAINELLEAGIAAAALSGRTLPEAM